MLLVHHIPKTAGTTWRSIVYRQFANGAVCSIYDSHGYFYSPAEFASLSDDAKNGFSALVGHFEYGFHERLPRRGKFQFMTFMRDPVARCVSLFNHLANDQFRGKVTRLSEFIDQNHLQFDNQQVRYLSGLHCGYGQINQEMVEAAIRRMSEFALVGVTERFEESYAVAVIECGFRVVPYISRNLGTSREEDFSARVDESERRQLRALNRLDAHIYEHANKLLDQRIARIRQRIGADWNDVIDRINEASQVNVKHTCAGYLDNVSQRSIRGWAMLIQSDIPATVHVFINEVFVGAATANLAREDLFRKGFQPLGRCAFQFPLPKEVALNPGDRIRVVEANSMRELQGSPMIFEPGHGMGE